MQNEKNSHFNSSNFERDWTQVEVLIEIFDLMHNNAYSVVGY